MNPEDITHRADTCPHRDMITNDHIIMCQILEKLEKIDAKLESHADKAEAQLTKIMEFIDNKYVSKESFNPVQKIVYGMVGTVMLSVLGALLTLVIQHAK